MTIPDGTFGAGAGTFLLALLKFRTTYMFSQRRLNINDLLEERAIVIREEERQRAIDIVKKVDSGLAATSKHMG